MSLYSKWRPLENITTGQNAKTNGLWTAQLQWMHVYLSAYKYGWRKSMEEGGKRNQEVCCVTASLRKSFINNTWTMIISIHLLMWRWRISRVLILRELQEMKWLPREENKPLLGWASWLAHPIQNGQPWNHVHVHIYVCMCMYTCKNNKEKEMINLRGTGEGFEGEGMGEARRIEGKGEVIPLYLININLLLID